MAYRASKVLGPVETRRRRIAVGDLESSDRGWFRGPSRGARRMVEISALLVDEVFPEQPVRQWVLSFPYPLRFLFARRPGFMGQVLGIVDRVIAGHLIKKAGFTGTRARTYIARPAALVPKLRVSAEKDFGVSCAMGHWISASIATRARSQSACSNEKRPGISTGAISTATRGGDQTATAILRSTGANSTPFPLPHLQTTCVPGIVL